MFWLRFLIFWTNLLRAVRRKQGYLVCSVTSFFDNTFIFFRKFFLIVHQIKTFVWEHLFSKFIFGPYLYAKIQQDVNLKCGWLQSWYFDFLSYTECSKVQANHFFELKNQNQRRFLITLPCNESWSSANFAAPLYLKHICSFFFCFVNHYYLAINGSNKQHKLGRKSMQRKLVYLYNYVRRGPT